MIEALPRVTSKRSGVVEMLRIAVGGAVAQRHRLAGMQRHPTRLIADLTGDRAGVRAFLDKRSPIFRR
jgi:hypothetical protein